MNLSPARDLSEVEMREQLALENDRRADHYEFFGPQMRDEVLRESYARLATSHRARACI